MTLTPFDKYKTVCVQIKNPYGIDFKENGESKLDKKSLSVVTRDFSVDELHQYIKEVVEKLKYQDEVVIRKWQKKESQ